MRDERILTATTKISSTNDGRINKNYAGSNAIRAYTRVGRKVDKVIRRINHYPVDSLVCFVNKYPGG